MRLTHRTRILNQTRLQLEAEMTAAILAELRWLWREIYPTIRNLKERRDGIQKQAKAVSIGLSSTGWPTSFALLDVNGNEFENFWKIDASIWTQFQERLNSKLAELIHTAATRLTDIEVGFWQGRSKDVSLSTEEIVNRYKEELARREGREVKDIADTTRREMGRRVAEWYNTPGATTQELVDRLQPYVSESRAAAIATTEVTWLNSAVTSETMNQLGVEEGTWTTMRDELVCVKPIEVNGQMWNGCRELHGQILKTTDELPPAHVNCRCAFVPKVL